jgi:hypothetical protein
VNKKTGGKMENEIIERVMTGAFWLRDFGADQPLPTADIMMPATLNEWLVAMTVMEIIPGKTESVRVK